MTLVVTIGRGVVNEARETVRASAVLTQQRQRSASNSPSVDRSASSPQLGPDTRTCILLREKDGKPVAYCVMHHLLTGRCPL